MDIGDLLERKAILPRLAAGSKRQALTVIGETAAKLYGAHDAGAALIEREGRGSTGVGFGVACPHARVDGLDRVRGVFARLETPIDFGAVDDQPVDLIFALISPVELNDAHLRSLARISRALRQGELRQRLRLARSADTIHALLVQEQLQGAAA